jgi:2-C-methyl-D-erythritol 4-phosphate cytidylyltransferase
MTDKSTACGIIVAAGRSARMGGTDKVFAPLLGRPLIVWPLAAFRASNAISRTIVVCAPETIQRMNDLVEEWRLTDKIQAVVAGGDTRQESVAAGLAAAEDHDVVAIHDGARPLVTPAMIDQGVGLAHRHGAALCAVRARDTIKIVDSDTLVVRETPPRESAWLAQTPQCFRRELLLAAHQHASHSATDDAALVEASGHPVHVYEGAWSNLKVTTQEDLTVAETLLRARFSS